MSGILGLMTTANLSATRSNNARRKVFYDTPNGRFPLAGLLSLMDDMEPVTDFEFKWYEEAWTSVRDTTKRCTTNAGPFSTASDGTTPSGALTVDAAAVDDTPTDFFLHVNDIDKWRVRDVIQIYAVQLTSGATVNMTAIVKAKGTTSLTINFIEALAASTIATSAATTSVNVGLNISMIGTATGEGDRSLSNGRSVAPYSVYNYTQIFRTTAGPWTGTALKMGQAWDANPRYKKDCKDAMLRHMEAMEKAFLFGVLSSVNVTSANNDTVPRRTLGGVEFFLKQYELGNTGNGGLYNYRASGSDITASSWTTEEEKRLITLSGAITSAQMEELIRRSFVSQSDKSFEKLVICGDKALAVINNWAKSKSLPVVDLSAKDEAYGMKIKKIETTHGDWLFKTHPLFKENPAYQSKLMILDMGDLGYHAMDGRDTELLKNRQNRDDDLRKDEWLTECTFELRHPRRHMVINNLTSILP